MEIQTESNRTGNGVNVNSDDLPVYLSTHSDIPRVFIHELVIAWMITGMLFNGFLIYYLLASKKYKSPVFMLVINLASTDFLVCFSLACLAGFVWPTYLLSKHTWILCKVVYYLFAGPATSSVYYLVFFAALRFYQMSFPLLARARVTSGFVRNWCLLILCVSMIAWSPFLLSYNLIDMKIDGRRSVVCMYTGKLAALRNSAMLIVNTSIPALSIPVLHLLKYIGLARTRNSVEVQMERKNTDFRALMIVIALFYVCWIPLNIYLVVYKYPPNHGPYQDTLALVLMYTNGSNNTLNPVVYCLAASSVRNDIVRLFCKKRDNTRKQHELK